MKKISLILLLLLSSIVTLAQKNVSGKLEQLKELQDRELIVVLKDERPAKLIKLEKKLLTEKNIKKITQINKEIESITKSITLFNTTIKELITNYWYLNSKINFRNESELAKMSKERDNKYALLIFRTETFKNSGTKTTNSFNSNTRTFQQKTTMQNSFQLTTPVIYYTKFESKNKIPVYRNLIPQTNYNFGIKHGSKEMNKIETALKEEMIGKETTFSKENLLISIVLTQSHIEKMLRVNKKISFKDYAYDEALNNCKISLKGKDLLIQHAIIDKKIIKSPEIFYTIGNLQTVSAKRIKEAIINKNDSIIAFPIIEKFIKSATGYRPYYHKIYVNTKTGKIVGMNKSSGIINNNSFTKKDLEKISKCDL